LAKPLESFGSLQWPTRITGAPGAMADYVSYAMLYRCTDDRRRGTLRS
jgi:hypothetical protein